MALLRRHRAFPGKIWDAEPRASVERMTDSMRFLDRIAGDEVSKSSWNPCGPISAIP